MTRAGIISRFHRDDSTSVEVVWAHTDAGIEIRSVKDACGFVDLTDDERERAVMMIEAEHAPSDDELDDQAQEALRQRKAA